MQTRTTWHVVAVAATLVVGLGSRARSDDAPAEDPGAMLRRARVAETVDRDLPRAIELYRRVYAAAGDSDPARDAALHLMDLLEARGDRAGALELARALTDRMSVRLDDAMKRQVHETMARALPAGSHAKSPLGDVYVLPAPGSASNPAPSPLEAKVAAILSRLDTATEGERGAVELDVLSALKPVGRDLLPLLERVLYGARPERARFAAQALAKVGRASAIPVLIKAVREGDGFARAAAIGGLEAIEPDADTSPEFVATVEPLLAIVDRPSGDVERLLLGLESHLDASACLDRYDRGGPDASFWLAQASEKDAIVTATRLAQRAARPEPLSDEIVQTVGGVAGVAGGKVVDNQFEPTIRAPRMHAATRLALLEAVARGPARKASIDAAASIAAALVRTGDAEQKARAATIAWALILDAPDPALVLRGADTLARFSAAPGADVVATPARVETFATAAAALLTWPNEDASNQRRVETILAPAIRSTSAPWLALERAVTSPDARRLAAARWAMIARAVGSDLPPPSEDARWLHALERSPTVGGSNAPDPLDWLRRAAARTNDPRFIEIARANLKTVTSQGEIQSYARAVSTTYRGPGRAALALEMMERWDWLYDSFSDWIGVEEEFWASLLDRLPSYPPQTRSAVLGVVKKLGAPPARFDARWIDDLRRNRDHFWSFEVTAAARSGSPEYLVLLRDQLVSGGSNPLLTTELIGGLQSFPPPERLQFLIELFSKPALGGYTTIQWVDVAWDLLATDPDPAAVAAKAAIARDFLAPGNARAIRALHLAKDRATLIELVRAAERSNVPLPERTRDELAFAAGTLHLREAVPFLLAEYQRGSATASKALDELRAYEDRIGAFEGLAGGTTPLAAAIDAVMKGPTVELRRAAVFALAATHGAKAVPSLLEVARTTPDEPVRAAAIEMIEKIARGTATGGAPPTPPVHPPTK